MKEKVLVGLSGGLDSAYCCELLREQGYEPVGVFLRFHSLSDPAPALALAKRLKIECAVEDVRDSFERWVIGDFLSSYPKGRTPNPCAVCNRYAKIPGLIACADAEGIRLVATGHYVDLRPGEQGMQIHMAKDKSRDQSYFLWDVPQEYLQRMITPLAQVIKKQIPARCGEMVCAGESRELCFAESGYEEYLRGRGVACPAGEFVDSSGRVLGRHGGIHRYTVGQRKGLEIALGRRCYVLAIQPESNRVVLGFEEEAKCRAFTADRIRFVGEPPFEGERELTVKVRYGACPTPVRVRVEGRRCRGEFLQEQKPVAPGQSAVFYQGERLLFGAVIEDSE